MSISRLALSFALIGVLHCPVPAAGGQQLVPLGQEHQVNSYTTGEQNLQAVASDALRSFVVVWQSAGSVGSDSYGFSLQDQRYSNVGMPVGGQFQVNEATRGQDLEPAVAADGAGNFVVVWTSDWSVGNDASGFSIQGRRFDAAGVPVGWQFQVNSYTTSAQSRPASPSTPTSSCCGRVRAASARTRKTSASRASATRATELPSVRSSRSIRIPRAFSWSRR